MQSQIVFSFLEQQQLLVPFLRQPKVLEDFTKEELLVLVEKFVNPQNVSYDTAKNVPLDGIVEPVVEQNNNVVINNEIRTKTIKLSLQETYDRLVNEGITSRQGNGKQIVNLVATELGLVEKYYSHPTQACYRPTKQGEKVGITRKSQFAVWYSLEAYEIIKADLLRK
jgi:hypothetical protein